MTGIIQGLLASLAGSAATVPDAPTIGTATATGSTTATVTYTAPVSNGGAAITSYTAIDQNGTVRGSISQAGSGTINLTGLSTGISYTFRVYATNSVGNSPNSSGTSLKRNTKPSWKDGCPRNQESSSLIWTKPTRIMSPFVRNPLKPAMPSPFIGSSKPAPNDPWSNSPWKPVAATRSGSS